MATTAFDMCIFVVVLEALLSWIQPDASRWPRRITHALTYPALTGLRRVLNGGQLAGVDISPIVLIMMLTGLKFAWRGVFS